MFRFCATPATFFLMLLILAGLTACDSSGGGPPEEEEDTTAPGTPSGLEGTSGDGSVALEWSAPGASDLEGYNVYRSESSFSNPSGAQMLNESDLVGEASYRDDEAGNVTTYFYRVSAVDESDNESDLSGMVEKTPFPDPPDDP
jgi:fibronectin type 3 domain-containing protein